MARYNRNKKARNKKSKLSKSTKLKRLAYDMGQVERGLKNPDSAITASFNSGKEFKKRKSLF